MTTTVEGRLRDIAPNAPRLRLELQFSERDAHLLASRHGDRIVIEVDGVRWAGTVGLKPPNPPYVHAGLTAGTNRMTCTELFLGLGLAERAQLLFDVLDPGQLRFVRPVHAGRWRPGGSPSERARRLAPNRDDKRTPSDKFGDVGFPYETVRDEEGRRIDVETGEILNEDGSPLVPQPEDGRRE